MTSFTTLPVCLGGTDSHHHSVAVHPVSTSIKRFHQQTSTTRSATSDGGCCGGIRIRETPSWRTHHTHGQHTLHMDNNNHSHASATHTLTHSKVQL